MEPNPFERLQGIDEMLDDRRRQRHEQATRESQRRWEPAVVCGVAYVVTSLVTVVWGGPDAGVAAATNSLLSGATCMTPLFIMTFIAKLFDLATGGDPADVRPLPILLTLLFFGATFGALATLSLQDAVPRLALVGIAVFAATAGILAVVFRRKYLAILRHSDREND